MSVEEIETAIAELPASELAHLLTWVDNFRATDPDALSEQQTTEIREGIARGLEAAATGRVKPLAQAVAEARQRHDFSPTWASESDDTAL